MVLAQRALCCYWTKTPKFQALFSLGIKNILLLCYCVLTWNFNLSLRYWEVEAKGVELLIFALL